MFSKGSGVNLDCRVYLFCNCNKRKHKTLSLTEAEKGFPLVSLSGELVCTHQLLKLPLGHMFQDVLWSKRSTEKQQHQCLELLSVYTVF